MRVWLFKDGEALPVERNSRRMRTGMLAEQLRRRNHDVHWFASTFLHLKKRLHVDHDCSLRVCFGLTLHLLHAGGFTRNLSYARHRFYSRYAERVRTFCEQLEPPDCIVCSFPLIDVATNAVRFGLRRRIAVILDVRDLWPDTVINVFARWLRPMARWALWRDFRKTRFCMRNATCLSAMSSGVLSWALNYAGRPERPMDRVIPIGYPRLSGAAENCGSAELHQLIKAMNCRRLFSYVGSFGHTYDLPLVARTARRILASGGRDIGFVLVGCGPRYAQVRHIVEGLPNVALTGWLDTAHVRYVLSQSCGGLLPWNGIDNAMPNKFFEYIAEGLPVVSSAHGELNALIARERIGVTYQQANEEELSRAVLRLAADGCFAKACSARARKIFASQFCEDVVYNRFASYVEEVATSKCG